MSTIIDPRSTELNYVMAGGVKSPGRCSFQGLGRPHNWQVLEGYGLSGQTMIYRGPAICDFTLTIELFGQSRQLAESFAQWAAFSKVITPKQPVTALKPFLVDMQHPLLAAAEIKTVAVQDPGVPSKAPDADRWTIVVKLKSYRPPIIALAKADKSISAVEKKPQDSPKTAQDIWLKERTDELARAELNAANSARRRGVQP